MLRVICLVLLASPAAAWDFSAAPVCTLRHKTPDMSVVVTYDPRQAAPYAIALSRRAKPWPSAPVFGLRFSGGRERTITTPSHALSDDGRTLTVRDQGFGNVLDGLEYNSVATAFAGATAAQMSLETAPEAVRAFRACTVQPSV